MNDTEIVADGTLFKELGILEEQTKAAVAEAANSEDTQEAVEGFFVTVGKILRKIFDL